MSELAPMSSVSAWRPIDALLAEAADEEATEAARYGHISPSDPRLSPSTRAAIDTFGRGYILTKVEDEDEDGAS